MLITQQYPFYRLNDRLVLKLEYQSQLLDEKIYKLSLTMETDILQLRAHTPTLTNHKRQINRKRTTY